MKHLRTSFILVAALIAFIPLQLHGQNLVNFPMSAWTTGVVTMHDGTALQFYGFSKGLSVPTLPGPVIELEEGDTLLSSVRNRSREHHSVHWHGLDVDQANDGVPHTSLPIDHDSTFTYRFVASHSGMYFYHCHVLSVWHVQLGMYGVVIVRPQNAPNTIWTGGPSFDRETYWLSSEIDKDWYDNVPEQHMGDSLYQTVEVPDYGPEYFLINGMGDFQLDTARSVRILGNTGEVVHLSIGNMGYFENRISFPPALNAQVVAIDGRPLPQQLDLDSLVVSPGERYSILLTLQGASEDSIRMAWHDCFNGAEKRVDFIPVIHGVGISNDESFGPETDQWTLYPVPADNSLYIQSSEPLKKNASYQVVDLQGRVLLQRELLPGIQEIQTGDLQAGIYVLKVSQAGSATSSKRFVIVR